VLDREAIMADHTEELALIMPGNSQRLRHFCAAATDIEPKPASSQVTRLGRGTAARSEHALPKHLPEDPAIREVSNPLAQSRELSRHGRRHETIAMPRMQSPGRASTARFAKAT
jgi:hypothetical protein